MKPKEAWHPADWELADVSAIKGLANGTATPDQQQRALKWIIESAAGTYQPSYRQSDRDTAFAEGRRFVGLQIVKALHLDLSLFRKNES